MAKMKGLALKPSSPACLTPFRNAAQLRKLWMRRAKQGTLRRRANASFWQKFKAYALEKISQIGRGRVMIGILVSFGNGFAPRRRLIH